MKYGSGMPIFLSVSNLKLNTLRGLTRIVGTPSQYSVSERRHCYRISKDGLFGLVEWYITRGPMSIGLFGCMGMNDPKVVPMLVSRGMQTRTLTYQMKWVRGLISIVDNEFHYRAKGYWDNYLVATPFFCRCIASERISGN